MIENYNKYLAKIKLLDLDEYTIKHTNYSILSTGSIFCCNAFSISDFSYIIDGCDKLNALKKSEGLNLCRDIAYVCDSELNIISVFSNIKSCNKCYIDEVFAYFYFDFGICNVFDLRNIKSKSRFYNICSDIHCEYEDNKIVIKG